MGLSLREAYSTLAECVVVNEGIDDAMKKKIAYAYEYEKKQLEKLVKNIDDSADIDKFAIVSNDLRFDRFYRDIANDILSDNDKKVIDDTYESIRQGTKVGDGLVSVISSAKDLKDVVEMKTDTYGIKADYLAADMIKAVEKDKATAQKIYKILSGSMIKLTKALKQAQKE